MTYGKRTCKILKEIRQQIAEKNDIEYVTSECHFRGECEGTCPKCEEELQYLENELNKRRQLGKAVAVAGIALGIVATFPDCTTYRVNKTIIKKPAIVTSAYTQAAKGTGAVTGKVSRYDNTTLSDANVCLMQNDVLIKETKTDTNGFFTIDSIPVGKYDITIQYGRSYLHKIKNIKIEESTLKYIGEIQLKYVRVRLQGCPKF